MQTINLQVEESFFPHFKALIDSFIRDNKVKIIDNLEKNHGFDETELLNRINDIKHNNLKPISREDVFNGIC